MAYEFKKLSDVNVIEAMKDGLNVLVEDGGEIVKLAANSMIPEDVALKSDIPTGVVKSVNGEVPDEAGNVKVSGLPDGSAAHQQLVTDGEGKAKWEDKPFYETGWRYAWDGDTSNMTAVSTNGLGTLYMVSESVVDFDAMAGEISVTAVVGGVECAVATDITEEVVAMWKEAGAMLFREGSFFIFAVVDKDKMSATPELVELIPELNEMDVGVYFSKITREIKSADYAIKPLDPKFLPTTVPVIQSATVGQTVVVKAVDESGKPTEWEAVDVITEARVNELIAAAIATIPNAEGTSS